MHALRKGAARLTPKRVQCVRTTKRFASAGASGWNPTHGVDEPIGASFWIFMSLLPAGCVIHWASRRGSNGELPWLTKLLEGSHDLDDIWKERNAVRSEALRQAAYDRLLYQTAPREKHYEMRYPETFHSHSRRNVTPGQLINLDEVTEKYRQQHLEMEEKKRRKMEAKELAGKLKAEK